MHDRPMLGDSIPAVHKLGSFHAAKTQQEFYILSEIFFDLWIYCNMLPRQQCILLT